MKRVISLADCYDAVIIGSGPNGLTAAIELAQANLKVCVFEAANEPGGGVRTGQLTLPGFCHDICSAVHPMGVASPAFRRYPLSDYGLKWIHPPAPLAHPFEDGTAVLVRRSVDETAAQLGTDAAAYRNLMNPLVEHWDSLAEEFLQPIIHVPHHPLRLGRFGLQGLHSADAFANSHFQGAAARAVFAGNAAHSILPLEKSGSAAFGLVLNLLAHAVGWPIPRGGSQSLTNALCEYLKSLGGEVVTGRRIENVDEFPNARAVLCDLTPRPLLAIAGHRFTRSYASKL